MVKVLRFASVLLLFLVTGLMGTAQILITEPFNYTAHATNGLPTQSSSAWTNVNSGDEILVTSGSLSYTGLAASTGNKIAFDGAGIDAYRTFTTQNTAGTTVYQSFILNVSSLGSLNTTGSYFTGVAFSSSSFFAIVWSRASSTSGKYNLGISTTTSSTVSWLSTDFTPGTPVFVVNAYQIISGTGNDVAKLWTNTSSFGGSEPAATGGVTAVTAVAGTDAASISQVFLRQAAATTTPFIQMDELRVGTTWASVTPAGATPAITGAATATAFTTTYGTESTSQQFSISGANMTAAITVTPPAGYEVSKTSSTTGFAGAATAITVGAAGTISATDIWIRLAKTAPVGTTVYDSKNIVLSSSGATNVNIVTAASGNAVTALPVTLTANDRTRSYGSTLTMGSGQTNFSLSATLPNSEGISSVTLAASSGNSATDGVNTYVDVITPSSPVGSGGFNASNYSITYEAGNITVNKATPTLTVTGSGSYSFDGNPQGPTTYSLPAVGGGAAPTGTVIFSYEGVSPTSYGPSPTRPSAAGTYKAVADYVGDANYNTAPSADFPFSINASTITVSGTLSAVNTIYGTASPSPTSFDLSGSGITDVTGVHVAAPSGFEVSTSIGSGYASSIDVGGAGSFGPTTIYVRLAANTNAGTYSGNVVCTSTDAPTQNVATASSTVSQKALTMSGLSAGASKIYDATTSASVSGTPSLQASEAFGTGNSSDGIPYTGDDVSITGTATGTYNSKDVASATTVTFGGLSLTGAQAGNYSLTIQSPASATITAKALTMSGLSVPASKIYNGNTAAVVSGTPALQAAQAPGAGTTADGKPYTGDAVSITGTAVGTYDSKDVATASTVAYSGLSLTGAQNTNYSLTIQGNSSATITAKTLTVTGLSVPASKIYDATTAAVVSGTAALQAASAPGAGTTADGKPYNVDVVGVTGTAVGTYNSKDFSTATTVTYSGLSLNGVDAGNYTLNQGTAAATITKKALTYTGLSVPASKAYDGNTTAVVSGTATLQTAQAPGTGTTSDGKPYTGDAVGITGTATGTYNSATVAAANLVTFGGLSLNLAQASNYSLTALTQAATITKSNQTITFGALSNKTTADAPFGVSATVNNNTTGSASGLSVSFSSLTPAVATVSGSTVTIQGAGTATIRASQAGDGNLNAATDVDQSFNVTLAPSVLAGWDFNSLPNGTPATFAATTYNSNLVTSGGTENLITRGSGAAASSAASSFRTTGFQNNGISTANTDYFQVTLQAVSGKALSLTSLTGAFNGTGSFYASPGVTSQFAYSLDGTNFTLIGSPVQSTSLTMTPVDLTGVSALQNVANGTNITLRYYASGQTTTGGWGFASASAGVNGLAVNGYVVNPCTPPVSQASSVTATNISTTGVDAGYTRGSSNGSVLAIRPTAISEVVPAQGATYTGNTNWNTADQINASNRVLNNSTAAASTVVAVNGVSNLSPETQYTLTAYEYSTAGGTCYNTSSAPSATFYTYSLEPTSHAASFSTTACNISSLLLTFSAASTITNADGYVILFTSDGSAPSTTGVTDGVASGSWTLSGTTSVLTVINSTAATTYNHTSLTPGGTYRYLLVPYNADASVNVGTYNYYIGGTPATATGVVGNASANSNLVEETSYQAGATNIAYGSYQAAPITTNSGCLPVFGLRLRDGGGAPDGDSKPTILTSITFSVNSVAQSAVRNYALFQGTTLIAQQVNPGTSTVTFSGLTLTAADNSNLDFALWASFNNTSGTITDNAQMSFSVSNAAVTSDCATNSSQFTTFTASSSTSGNINRLEVTATQIAFGTQPTDGVFNVNLSPFTVRFEDANNILDFDNNRTVTLTTTGANMSPATPSGSITAPHTGIVTFSTVQYTTGPQDNITITANTTGLSTNSVQSNTFDISAVVYTTNDYRTVQAGTWSTQTNGTATFEKWDGSGWVPSSRPTATTHTIFVRHAITSNGSIQLDRIIVETGGSLTISSGGSTNYIEIQNGGTITKNGAFAVASSASKNFIIQSGGKFIIQDTGDNGAQATTNASSIWNGNEDFQPGSTVEIRNWGANNATTANQTVFNGTNISTNTYSGYTAAFGNLTVNLTSSSMAGSLRLLSSGVTANLAHGNLTLLRGDNLADISISTGSVTTVTSGIGGDFIVDANFATLSPGSQIQFKPSGGGTLNFTIKGNMLLNSATTRVLASTFNSSASGSNVTVEGDITLTNSALLMFNQSSIGTGTIPVATLNLKGDLTVGTSAYIDNNNSSLNGVFNFTGTGDGLTAATTQTIDIASTNTNENRYISFTVANGAYVQLINRDFQIGNSSSLTVANGGVFDFGFNGATALNLTEVPATATATAFTLAAGGKIKISHANGIDAGTALEGNVRTDSRTYSTTGIYHYIGKTPSQRLGDGLPTASSGKYVIVELDALTTNLVFEGYNGSAYVTTGPIALSNAGNGLKIIQGTVTGTTTADFTGTANLEMTGGLYKINVPAATSIVPQLSGAYTMTGGTVEINSTAAAQSLRGSRTYYGLTVSGAAPTTVLKNITDNIGVNGTLTFDASGGVLTTNAYKVSIGATGSVSGASQANGWVHGFLEKNVATGAGVLRDFEIGDNDDYTPVNLNFASVSTSNNLTASTISADHVNIATSRVIPAKSVNRNWTVTNGGVDFTTYSANFNFKAADVDGGVNTSQLFVAKYNTPNWSYPATGARSTTSVQIINVNSFSDFQIGEVDTFIWNGSVSTAWADSVNWSPNYVPADCPDHIIIPAGTPFSPVISAADVSVGNVDIASNATLTLQGRDLNVCGNWYGGTGVANASVLGTGTTFINNGTQAQTINGLTRFNTLQINNSPGVSLAGGGAVSIGVGLHLQAGNFNISNGTLRLLSTASNNHSYIDNFSFGVSPGTLTGSILADRYVPVAGRNQHFISSPVRNPALSQIGASGPDGSYITPTADCDEQVSQVGSAYGSVFLYDDGHRPNGACMLGNWMVKSSGNMETGRGYSAYLTGNSIVTLSGVPNTGDTVAFVKNSGYGTVNTKQLQPIESGWNLIGNPYPSAIDLTISRAGNGFSNQVQVWQTTGPFAGSWQPVVINGTPGTVVIPPFQGFMVRRTDPGNSSYPFFQSERTRNTNRPFYRRAADNSLTLELDYNGIKDVTTVEFNLDATTVFDNEYDANKSGAINRPTLYTHLNANMWYSVNTLHSIAQTSTVPVGLRPEVNGTMTITPQGLSTFDPTTYVYLEDKKTGLWHNLRNGAYTFTANKTDDQNRFVLHFTPPAEILSVDASCSESGVITMQQPGSANWNYKIEDQNNVVIATGVLNSSNTVGVNVVAGVYTLTLVDNNGYTVIKNIQVNGVQPIIASFTPSVVTAQTGDNITFTATTSANLYMWDFGDGTGATSATVNHQYQAEGTYMVKLTVTNSEGCQSTTTQSITITARSTTGVGNQTSKDEIQIWSSDNRVFVDFGKLAKSDANVDLYNVIGQLMSSERVGKLPFYAKEISNIETGYLIVKVTNEGKITTKRVFIGK